MRDSLESRLFDLGVQTKVRRLSVDLPFSDRTRKEIRRSQLAPICLCVCVCVCASMSHLGSEKDAGVTTPFFLSCTQGPFYALTYSDFQHALLERKKLVSTHPDRV